MQKVSFLLAGASLLLALGCSPNEENNESGLSIGGRLGTSLAKRATGSTPDQVVAIPVFDGSPFAIAEGITRLCVTGDIQSNGAFGIDIPLDVSEKWILVLTNTAASNPQDRIVGFASMGFDNSNLTAIPVNSVTSSAIELGTLEADTSFAGELVSDSAPEANAAHFELSLADLSILSDGDDMIKSVKNGYLATLDGKYRCVYPIFYWYLRNQDLAAFSDPLTSATSVAPVYGVHFDVPPAEIAPEDVSSGSADIAIVSPAPVQTLRSPDGTPSNPTAVIDDSLLYSELVNADVSYTVINTPYCYGAIPSGWWKMTKAGADYLFFDVGSGWSSDSSGKPRILVPSCRLVADANDRLTSIVLKWYQYSDGSYVLIDNPSLLEKIAGNTIHIRLESVDNSQRENIYPSISSATVSSTLTSWRVSSGTDSERVGSVAINYDVSSISYSFNWSVD